MGVTIQVHQILDVAIPAIPTTSVRVIGPGVRRSVWPSLERREHLLLSSHQQPAATWLEQFVSMFFGVKSGTTRLHQTRWCPLPL